MSSIHIQLSSGFRRGNPCLRTWGGSGAFLALCCVIAVAVRPLDNAADLPADSLADTAGSLNVETASRPHCYAADPCTEVDAFGEHRLNHVAGLKAFDPLLARQVSTRKAELVLARPAV